MSWSASIRSRGGAAATHELYSDGFGRADIRAAVAAGRIVRVRQGWYVLPGLPPDWFGAVRVGGRATCGGALRALGVWVAPDPRVHVAVERNACQLRRPRDAHARLREADAVVHWRTRTGGSRLTVDPIEAVLDLAACSGPELAAASAESLWRQRPHLAPRLLRAIAGLAEPFRWVEGSCESGTEFLTRIRLGRRGIALRPQVVISDVGRVDFVLGERLVIEVDGAQYHTDPERFEADRRRDAVLSSLGFRVLRFSYRQVMERWQEVEAAVFAAQARGDHL